MKTPRFAGAFSRLPVDLLLTLFTAASAYCPAYTHLRTRTPTVQLRPSHVHVRVCAVRA
jgi:hypothetical protein